MLNARDRVPERPLRRVVRDGDLDVLDLAEGPQRVLLGKQPRAEVGCALMLAAGALLKQCSDTLAQRGKLLAQPAEIMLMLAVGVMDADRLARSFQELSAELPGLTGTFGERDQRPDPVALMPNSA